MFLVLSGGFIGGVGTAVAMGGRGWVWPILFLVGTTVVGVLVGRQPWLVVGLVLATGALLAAPDDAVRIVGSVWMWIAALVGAAALIGGVRRCLPGGATVLWHLAFLLPPGEREPWRAEVRTVLHACASSAEARRQVVGFLAAVPATVVASWRAWR